MAPPSTDTDRYFIAVRHPSILGHMIGEIQANGGVISRNSRIWPPIIDCEIDNDFADMIRREWNGVNRIKRHNSDRDVML